MAREALKTALRAFNFVAKKVWQKWDKNDCLSTIREMPQYGIFDPFASLALNKRELTASHETNLKRIRAARGFSQKQLAELSGVNLRSIQIYEQRQKDINKAQSDSLFRLAKALGCKMENLLENA